MTEHYIQLPPDGVGKKICAKRFLDDGVEEYAEVVLLGSGEEGGHENVQYVDPQGAAYVRFSEGKPIMDPNNRLKTVHSNVVGIYEFTNSGYDDLFFDYEDTGGTVEYSYEQASVVLSTTSEDGSHAMRTTNRYHYFQQGCPLVVHVACSVGDVGTPNNVRRMGYYDDNDGWFFELNGTTIYCVQRSSASGAVIEQRVAQADWNEDRLDGTGLSGVTIDPTMLYTWVIDIAWPVGEVRFGLYAPSGDRVICHEFQNAGAGFYPATRTASLPVRFENHNEAAAASGSDLKCVMACVLAQGAPGYTFWRYGGLSSGSRSVTTNTPVLSLSSKVLLDSGGINHINVFPECLSAYVAGGPVRVDMVSHGAGASLLTGDTWSGDVGCTVLADNTATAIDDNADGYWIMHTFYLDEGITDKQIEHLFELNDEGLLLGGDGATTGILSFVCTKLDSGDTVTVDITISVKELW